MLLEMELLFVSPVKALKMKNRGKENAPNEGFNLQADALTDLPVPDRQPMRPKTEPARRRPWQYP